MNILEKIIKEANDGNIARPENVVRGANSVDVETDHYTNTGKEIEEGDDPTPSVVDARTIKDAINNDYRETAFDSDAVITGQGDTPYLNQDGDERMLNIDDVEMDR